MEEFILKWWYIILSILAAIFGWLLGTEKNKWRIESIERDLYKMEVRLVSIEKITSENDRMSTKLIALLERLEERMDRIESKLDKK